MSNPKAYRFGAPSKYSITISESVEWQQSKKKHERIKIENYAN